MTDVVAPGIERIELRTPTLPPATHTNCYLVGTTEAILVEPASPYPEEIERAVAFVEARRAEGIVVRAIVATHHHIDHIGGATALARRLSLPLWAHELTIERLRGQIPFDRALAHDETLVLGDTRLRVVHTPGHAPGHVCLLDEDTGTLLAGDMVASIGTILVDPLDGDMALYLDSLRAMLALDATVLLPAHGDPIREPRAKLEGYVTHRLMREAKVLAALVRQRTPATVDAIVPDAYDDAPPALWPLAALSAESHLRKLRTDGKATYVDGRWSAASG